MTHFGVVAPALPSHFAAFAALGEALIARGHRVTFFHQDEARRWLNEPRFGFRPLGETSHPPGSLDRTLRLAARPKSPWGLRRLIHDLACTTDMLCRTLPEALDARQVDALLCDQMEPAGALVARATGRPFVSLACALPINREPGLPLPVMPFAYADNERARRLYAGSTRVFDALMAPQRRVLDAQARHLGLSPEDGPSDGLSPRAQLSQTVAAFDFPRRALPGHFHHVGPLRPGQRPRAPLGMPGDSGRPLVFASLGTLQGHRFALFRRIARACRRLDVQLLLAHCGGLNERQEAALKRDGATWVTAFADQPAALARADALITHGGLNTVLDALAARVPMLVMPLAFDQPGVAARVAYHGVGLSVSPRLASAWTLSTRLQRLLSGDFGAALEGLGAALDAAGGAEQAAAIVEEAVGQGAASRQEVYS